MIDVFAVVFVALGVVGYWWRADFATYSLFTVGVFERLDRQPTNDDKPCAECGSDIDSGEQRTYYKEIVIAGMPTVRYGVGHAYYCADHASFEFEHGAESDTQRLPKSIVEGVARFGVWVAGDVPDMQPDDSELGEISGDITSDFSSAARLLPAALLILTAGLLIQLVGMFGRESL